MRWKTTLILLIATVGIGSYISLYEIRQPSPEQRERLSKQILSMPADSVTQLVLDLPKAKVTLTRDKTTWRLSPQGVRADEGVINQLLGHLAPLMAERILSDSPEHPLNSQAFGLDPAVGRLTLVSNGAKTTLLMGETTPVHGNRYLKVADHPAIYVVSSNLFDDANRPTETFRDPLLIRFSTWLADGITVTSLGSSFALTRNESGWSLTQPFIDRAERSEVNALMSGLSGITIKRFLDEGPQVDPHTNGAMGGVRASWGFDHPKAEVTLLHSDAPASITLLFGKPLAEDPSLVYAKRSDEPLLYAVASADVEPLVRDPHGLRAKACFDFVTSNARKVEVMREGTSWTIAQAHLSAAPGASQTGAQWKEERSEMILETQRVEEFLSKLADLRISGFVDEAPSDLTRYGLEPPFGAIAVWTVNRDEPQRLLIGATIEGSANRYGRIEGRNAIVRLPDLVTELLATATDQLAALATPSQEPTPNPPTP
jgi:hypothetical protein